MEFNFTDALLLHTIHANERPEGGAELLDIMGYGDYIDHSVLEYHELSGSLTKLLPLGLVTQSDQKLATTDVYKNWWNATFAGKKRVDVHKALQAIKEFLNTTFTTAVLPETATYLHIQPAYFSSILDIYLKRS